MIDSVTQIIGLGTLLIHGLLLVATIWFLVTKKTSLCTWIGKRGIIIAYSISLGALLGSLFYSEIAKLEPCVLCWYQRIPMYANVLILGWALFKQDRHVIQYGLVLAWTGVVIAIYQVLLPFLSSNPVTCSPSSTISCSENYFALYGYITIPVMSLTVFVVTAIALHLAKKYE